MEAYVFFFGNWSWYVVLDVGKVPPGAGVGVVGCKNVDKQ